MFKPDATGLKFGPFWITPGLSGANVATIVFASFTTVEDYVIPDLVGLIYKNTDPAEKICKSVLCCKCNRNTGNSCRGEKRGYINFPD